MPHGGPEAAALIRWRSWPLSDHARWSWLLVAGMLGIGGIVWYLGGGWLLSTLAVFGLAGTLWQLLLPVDYEVNPLGLRRNALGRTRLIPWHAVRAYQLRPSGIELYRHSDPAKFDVLRGLFVPFPADEDSMLCAMREHLTHAVELPL
ncbi:MAG: hypothetical protein WD229_12010 [Pirellulales bacterium]